jgi:hypothetical protein
MPVYANYDCLGLWSYVVAALPLDTLGSSHFRDGWLLLLMVVVVAARIGDVHEGIYIGESEQSPNFQC